MSTMIHHHHIRSGLSDNTDTALMVVAWSAHVSHLMGHVMMLWLPDDHNPPPHSSAVTMGVAISTGCARDNGDQEYDAIQETHQAPDTRHVVTLTPDQ